MFSILVDLTLAPSIHYIFLDIEIDIKRTYFEFYFEPEN